LSRMWAGMGVMAGLRLKEARAICAHISRAMLFFNESRAFLPKVKGAW